MYDYFLRDKTHGNTTTHPPTTPFFLDKKKPPCWVWPPLTSPLGWWGRWVGPGASREGRQGERCRRSEARSGASVFAGSRTGETNQGVARRLGAVWRGERGGVSTWLDLPVVATPFSTRSLGFHDPIWYVSSGLKSPPSLCFVFWSCFGTGRSQGGVGEGLLRKLSGNH